MKQEGLRGKLLRISLTIICLTIICLTVLLLLTQRTFEKIDDKPFAYIVVGKSIFYVEIANAPAEHYRGLSGRKYLSPGTGMLFIFDDEHIRSFWMKDCYIPLDIAFISGDWHIVSIKTMTVWPDPQNQYQKQYSSDKPCKYALEVPAGELKNAGIRVGDKITAIF